MKCTVVLLLNNLYAVIYIVSLCVGINNLLITCRDSTFVRSGHISCHVCFNVPYSQLTNQ